MSQPASAPRIPSLRFPEFSGEWEERSLEDMINITSGISPSNYSLNPDSGLPFVKVEDLNNCSKYQLTAREYSASSRNVIDSGSIIFPKRGAAILLNKIRISYTDILMDSNMMALTIKSKNYSSEFLYYKMLDEDLSKIADTSSIPQINNKHILPYKVFVSSLHEQTKIASFLSTVDSKIDQLSQKKTLLEQYKKGAMQQIFSQQIRFKADDGSDYPEWEEKKLGEVASKNMQKNKGSTIIYVLTNSASQGIVSQQDYFDKDIANQNNLENYYVVDVDDFVYNPRISVHAPVGPIKRNKLAKGVMSPLYTVFSFIKDSVVLAFIEMYFSTNCWHDYMLSISNFGARHDRMNISGHDFFEMPIFFPCLEEQTKIANFLSAIDNKIEQVAKQLEIAKQFKKGLLQQMFV